MWTRTTLAALTAALVAAAAPAPAQVLAENSLAPVSETETAQSLHDQADQLVAEHAAASRLSRRALRQAAELHVRSAQMRAADDPMAVECLRAAANLLHVVNAARAASLLEQAGDRALARGDVLGAARTYLDLASLQQARRAVSGEERARLDGSADRFARKAELLLHSPLIPEAQRAELLRRIQGQSASPRLATR